MHGATLRSLGSNDPMEAMEIGLEVDLSRLNDHMEWPPNAR